MEHRIVIDGMRFTPQVVQVKPGDTFDYLCTLHPMMTGRVELAAAGKQPHAPRDPPPKMK